MIERPDPDALLAGPLGQWLTGQQDLRLRTKATIAKRRRLATIGTGAFGIVLLLLMRDLDGAFVMTGMFALVAFGWAEMPRLAVDKAVKGAINQAIARALGLEFADTVSPGDEWTRAKTFQLVPQYDASAFEDCWSGMLGPSPFRLYEAHCEEYRGTGKDRKLVTVFRGVAMAVGFTRRFHGATLVERDGRRKRWFGGEKEELALGDARLQRCDMVDPAFEARFTVWGDDPVEARYLVHPGYIERLIAIEQAFAGNGVRALFCGGELLIVLDSADLFESGGLEASDDRARLVKTIEQFGSLADLAARLNEAPRGNYTPAAPA